MAMESAREYSSGVPSGFFFAGISLLTKNTMVRYRKKIVRAEQMALIELTITAAFEAEVNIVNNLAMIWNTGFPGGWPTSSLYEDAMNSPQSQKDAVGSIVERYVNAEIRNTAAAVRRFHCLNFLLSINL